MRYLCHTRNKILLRAVPLVSPFVEYNYFFLPIQRGNRFQQLRKIDHCHRCNEAWLLQLMCRLIASFNVLVSTYIIAMASTRTANLIDCNFHTIRYLLILRTPRGAPEALRALRNTEKREWENGRTGEWENGWVGEWEILPTEALKHGEERMEWWKMGMMENRKQRWSF